MARKKRGRGHFCWACGQIKSNEHFSGRGHNKHICKECSKLGAGELKIRQGKRNIDRCFGMDGRLQRKSRTTFEKLLQNPNPKIREYALHRQIEINNERQLFRAMLEVESDLIERGLLDQTLQLGDDEMAKPFGEISSSFFPDGF